MVSAFTNKVADAKFSGWMTQMKLTPICNSMQSTEDAIVQDMAAKLAASRGLAPDKVNALQLFRFNLIASHLIMHHVFSLSETLRVMSTADRLEGLGPDATLFHPKSKWENVERHGVNVVKIREAMAKVGFVNVDLLGAFSIPMAIEREEEQGPPLLDIQFLPH